MLGMNWLTRKLKKNMTPLDKPYAKKMRQRLAMIYAFLGWNFVAGLLYLTFKTHIPTGPGKTQKTIELMNLSNTEIIQMEGFSKVGEYTVDRRDDYLKGKERGKIRDMEFMVDKEYKEAYRKRMNLASE